MCLACRRVCRRATALLQGEVGMARDDEPIGAPGAGWSSQRQWRWLFAACALIAIVIVFGMLAAGPFSQRGSGETAPAPPAGTFRPTPQQLKTLTIEPVALHQFVSQE